MPVMEGKAVLFDALVGINGVPILLATKDVEEIIRTVAIIAPTFGAIKLEDIKAPELLRESRTRLDAMLDIPVMHDDQHGTATVALACTAQRHQVRGQALPQRLRGVWPGRGRHRISKLLIAYGVKHMVGTDINRRPWRSSRRPAARPCRSTS